MGPLFKEVSKYPYFPKILTVFYKFVEPVFSIRVATVMTSEQKTPEMRAKWIRCTYERKRRLVSGTESIIQYV